MPTSWAGSTFTADVSASISLGRLWPSWGARVIQVLTTPRSGLEGDQDRTCHTLEAFSSLGSTRWRRFLQIQVCYTRCLYGSEEFLAINGKFFDRKARNAMYHLCFYSPSESLYQVWILSIPLSLSLWTRLMSRVCHIVPDMTLHPLKMSTTTQAHVP